MNAASMISAGEAAVTKKSKEKRQEAARSLLGWIALFLGELRDGLTMINMQSAFLITSKNYSEKQAGILFFVFGMSQFLFQTPSGYVMDYSDKKVALLATASITTTAFTVFTAAFAKENGGNLGLMVFIKFLQGAVTSLIPPGLNSITQGIVGSVGMTKQVARNEMMNHLGTAIIVLSGSLLAFALFPSIGLLFVVSPIACAGVLFFLSRLKPDDIDHNAARGLSLESKTGQDDNSTSSYKPPITIGADGTPKTEPPIQTQPSFTFGFGLDSTKSPFAAAPGVPRADTPWKVLRDPTLLTFILTVFLFHLSNGTVLPLVMQSLAIGNGRAGILMSGLCIIVAQVFMVMSAKICGDYSAIYGRKTLFLIGFISVPIRCFLLTWLVSMEDGAEGTTATILSVLILSTQILDGVGAGTFGTMYILVTSDISGGTGRFSFILGLTTAAMSIGGTVSGYLGEALAEDIGYKEAFAILGFMAMMPFLLYLFCMPETLPAYARADNSSGPMDSIREEADDAADDAKKAVANAIPQVGGTSATEFV